MRKLTVALSFVIALGAAPAAAAPIVAADDGALASLAAGFQRQQDVFATLENGLSLDVIFQDDAVQQARDFFAQTATDDFQAFSGRHPFDAIATFEEWGDEGNFAGISSVGVAARLLTLKASGAPADEIDRARAAAVRCARAWHVFGSIGGKGVVARGVRRRVPEDAADPPLPATLPDVTPLRDGAGAPLPVDKQPTWRAAVAPGLDDWMWLDDTSKDQVSGYALAVAWLWDALHDDAAVPADVTADLASDLDAFAQQLMVVAPELDIDLCIRDADGRLTSFHDLNPRQVSPDAVLPPGVGFSNGFNAALALGVVRAAYHVSGDEKIGRYYYEELVGKRDLPASAATFTDVIYVDEATNYSNVNMLAIALATIGRFETDDGVRAAYGDALETQFWSAGSAYDASHIGQAWFDVIYGGFSANAGAEVATRVAADLASFQPAPAFERERVNCDDAEIAADSCVAIDGTTAIPIAAKPGHGGSTVAVDVVPMSVRPDSDFEWRSDPRRINGHASSLMDPRGDWLTAYWLGRLLDLGDPKANISASARAPLPYTHGGDGGSGGGATSTSATSASSTGAGGEDAATADSGGCDCAAGAATPSGPWWLIAAGLLACRRRRLSV